MDAREIVAFIRDAKKVTPVKIYLNGKNLPPDLKCKCFGTSESRILIGDINDIEGYIDDYKERIYEYYIEYDRRNSAVPLLDTTKINARIEPGSIIRDKVQIGDNAVIMMGSIINIGASVGCNTMIDMGVVLGGRAIVGDNCHIGAGTVLAGVIEPISAIPVIIEDNVVIGANCVILEGVRVGFGAVIGAGSIVTSDVLENSVVYGNPARVVSLEKSDKVLSKTEIVDDLRRL